MRKSHPEQRVADELGVSLEKARSYLVALHRTGLARLDVFQQWELTSAGERAVTDGAGLAPRARELLAVLGKPPAYEHEDEP